MKWCQGLNQVIFFLIDFANEIAICWINSAFQFSATSLAMTGGADWDWGRPTSPLPSTSSSSSRDWRTAIKTPLNYRDFCNWYMTGHCILGSGCSFKNGAKLKNLTVSDLQNKALHTGNSVKPRLAKYCKGKERYFFSQAYSFVGPVRL